jgi:hypothetical protein
VPFPDPLAPDEIDSHVALLAAVHAQPAATVTPTLPVAAPAPTDPLAGESAGSHGAPAWLSVNVWPAIVSVALRGDELGLLATL